MTRATSVSLVPQTLAKAAPTNATRAGSLGSPRKGGGERYGVSVSTRARSGGTTAAAMHVLEEGGFRALMEDAIRSAAQRSCELGRRAAGDQDA